MLKQVQHDQLLQSELIPALKILPVHISGIKNSVKDLFIEQSMATRLCADGSGIFFQENPLSLSQEPMLVIP
jgi:hypothetical protein